MSNAGLTQFRIAETEKYAHVTYFLNGGREEAFPGEERILVPSPKVATYDLQPEMSAREVTRALSVAIESKKFDLVVVNFANPDMVGHTGGFCASRDPGSGNCRYVPRTRRTGRKGRWGCRDRYSRSRQCGIDARS